MTKIAVFWNFRHSLLENLMYRVIWRILNIQKSIRNFISFVLVTFRKSNFIRLYNVLICTSEVKCHTSALINR